MNYYEILEIDSNGSTQEIKKAYFKNAKKHHPDHNQGCEIESAEKFKKIQEAYLILSDPFKRQIYNLQLIESEIIFEQQQEINIFVFFPNPQYSIFQNFAIGISQSFSGITLGSSAIILSGVAGISGIAWSVILSTQVSSLILMSFLPTSAVAVSCYGALPYSSLILMTFVGISFLTHSIHNAHFQISNICFKNGLSFLCAGIISGVNVISYISKNIYLMCNFYRVYLSHFTKKYKEPINVDWVFI